VPSIMEENENENENHIHQPTPPWISRERLTINGAEVQTKRQY
jgi:hypothetical protein